MEGVFFCKKVDLFFYILLIWGCIRTQRTSLHTGLQTPTLFDVFDAFVCISFMCLRVHVDLIRPEITSVVCFTQGRINRYVRYARA